MKNLIEELAQNIKHHKKQNSNISKAAIDWHIDHSLKVFNGVTKNLLLSKPDDYIWSFNVPRMIVLSFGKIPRGKAKAPKSVDNQNTITLEDLDLQIKEAFSSLTQLENTQPKQNFQHPFFGLLTAKQTKKFLKIHTNHHLNIIKDILKNSKD